MITDPSRDTVKPGQELLAQLLRAGHRVRVTAHGISMLPTIGDGQQVVLEPVQSCSARRGDIVYVQRADHSYALHRVVRTFADGWLQTRGDAHWRLDDAVPADAVVGRVQDDVSTNTGASRLQALQRSARVCTGLAWSWVRYRYESVKRWLGVTLK